MELKERFIQNCLKFSENRDLIESLWLEIEKKHSRKGRFYHNLEHLESMFSELEAAGDQIRHFATVSFSVFYHDIIYHVTSKSNEEKSAELAVSRLEGLQVNQTIIKDVFEQILATKTHQLSNHHDTNFLLDADLSILGKSPESYIQYTQKIRKEYSLYPDLLYIPGRKKVLQHFLELESIFKTDFFKTKYEKQAKENIQSELDKL
ncbi:hypothetical protein CHRYSEOSP005_32060 [Chryseobacterium sp. Alg-005]|uniref:HD domain-containing protein n=1 Tax=Chryseobacterium sp. Alg-005 TaxID=3159516 RepID=UPI003555A274